MHSFSASFLNHLFLDSLPLSRSIPVPSLHPIVVTLPQPTLLMQGTDLMLGAVTADDLKGGRSSWKVVLGPGVQCQ